MLTRRSSRRRSRGHELTERSTRSRRLPPPCAEEHVASVQTLQEASSITATSSASLQADDTIEVLPPAGLSLCSSGVSTIWARLVRDWGTTFYIRADRMGCFYTYPSVGGPFHNLEEAHNAIDRHLHDRQAPKRYMKKDTPLERVIWTCLHWPDGSIKKRSKSYVMDKTHNGMCRLVQALVDKYNEDENLLGDLAYELKNVLHYQSIYENRVWYFHLNFTATTKGADDSDTGTGNLFFVEIKRRKHGTHEEFLVSCICKLNPLENGQRCYGCTNNGTVDMKHPDSAAEYAAGHVESGMPFGGCFEEWSDSEDDETYVKTKELKFRRMYKGLDDPRVKEKLFTLPPGVTRCVTTAEK